MFRWMVKLPRGEYIRLMGDLMVASLQSGLTNVATFMVGPERWDTPYLFESLFDKPKSHHMMSHNQGKFVEDLIKVDSLLHGAICLPLRKNESDRGG